MDDKDIEIIPNYEELSPKDPSKKGNNSERRSRGLFPFKRVESETDTSWFDIFGFGNRSVLSNNLRYGLTLALPQCDCKRMTSNPITFDVAQAIKDNPKFKSLPKQVKGERCTRFNQWWLKCCQSAVLKRQGIYWNLIHLLGVKVTINSQQTPISELVLGKRITLAIDLDIKRTYPSLRFFNRYGRSMLRRVLMAYAFFDTEVGYVQGLNFIVANLLWHSSEEQAFWALISMMYLYDLRCMFLPGLPGVFKRCEILEHCMVKHIPRLHNHLKSVGVHIPMIASDWFMTLCANSVPIRALGILWDSFFSEGWIAIFRFVIFRLKQFEEYLVTMTDIADIMKVIKYGNASLTEKFHLIELIPGFGGVNRKRVELINAAYSTNVENLTNDPNKNTNDRDWVAIVEESLNYQIEATFIENLELTNSEIMYFDIPQTQFEMDLDDLRSDGLKSCLSSENSLCPSDEEMGSGNELEVGSPTKEEASDDNASGSVCCKEDSGSGSGGGSDPVESTSSPPSVSVPKLKPESKLEDSNLDPIQHEDSNLLLTDTRGSNLLASKSDDSNLLLTDPSNSPSCLLSSVKEKSQLSTEKLMDEDDKGDKECGKECGKEELESDVAVVNKYPNKAQIDKATRIFQEKLEHEMSNRANNKDVPAFSEAIKSLQDNSLSDIAAKLENLANSFRSTLDAIGVSKAYHLHLKALRDEL